MLAPVTTASLPASSAGCPSIRPGTAAASSESAAHASAAIKAAGYATASTVVLVNDWPKKFETLVKRFYTLVATVGASGRECDKGERACLAVLAVKGKYAGDKATHDRHVERFKNFMRSPVNF